MKALLVDLERAPHEVYAWDLREQYIPVDRLKKPSYTLCWSAKWLGQKAVMFDSIHQSSHREMLKGIHALMNEADVIIGYNSSEYDVPILYQDFLMAGMKPPAPSKQIDLLKVIRQQFNFPSNKLAYVIKALGLGEKVDHEGFDLWVKCMHGDEAAWQKMREYNIRDTVILEPLYNRLKPWIKHHPNAALYIEDPKKPVCPVCESQRLQRRGFKVVEVKKYQRWQCQSCGCWPTSRVAEKGEAKVKV